MARALALQLPRPDGGGHAIAARLPAALIVAGPTCSGKSALALALADEAVARFVTGEIKKVIFVPKRLLNLVV